jgi:alpha-pyrone synthase
MPGCEDRVYPIIRGLATGNPKYQVSQKDALELAMRVPDCDGVRGNLGRIYANTRIQYRHMAVPDFTPKQTEKDDPRLRRPVFPVLWRCACRSSRKRLCHWLLRCAARRLSGAGVAPEKISKLVMVSSTGFLGPGLDCALIQELGLRRDMDRSLIGFMGCAAAMNGFRICNDYVRVNPGTLALLCCVELSSVHTTFDDDAMTPSCMPSSPMGVRRRCWRGSALVT